MYTKRDKDSRHLESYIVGRAHDDRESVEFVESAIINADMISVSGRLRDPSQSRTSEVSGSLRQPSIDRRETAEVDDNDSTSMNELTSMAEASVEADERRRRSSAPSIEYRKPTDAPTGASNEDDAPIAIAIDGGEDVDCGASVSTKATGDTEQDFNQIFGCRTTNFNSQGNPLAQNPLGRSQSPLAD